MGPKAKHPCEALGKPSSFPLDDFKRDDELTLPFMSANQCTGFHTRLEASRKYLFGSLSVYGVANASKIIGVYLIRGNDYKGVFDVAPDYESYNFPPLDYKTDREFIEKVWSWEGEVEGLTVADGKVFK